MDTVLSFLRLLYGEDPPGHIVLWTLPDKRSSWFLAKEMDKAAEEASELAQSKNVYFGIGLQKEDLGPKKRGKEESVSAIPGLWIDMDVKGPAHKEPNLPSTKEEALTLLQEFPLPPTVIIDSGNGLQVWYLFKELWVLENEEERTRAEDLSHRFSSTIRARAKEHGWNLDNTSDLARVLRPPGTWNRKLDPVPVCLIKQNEANRYNPSDFEDYLIQTQSQVKKKPRFLENFPPVQIEPIVEGCGWMKHCRDDVKTLSEPEWYAMLSILGRCNGGEKLAHEWSGDYPNYRPEETEEKLQHALEAAGPRTCQDVRENLNGEPYCKDCQHWERTTSPIVLGNPDSKEEAKKDARQKISNLVLRVKEDPGAPFEEENLRALALLRKEDPGEWARTKKILQSSKVPLRELNHGMRRQNLRLIQADRSKFSEDLANHTTDTFKLWHSPDGQYMIKDASTFRIKETQGGKTLIKLSNFVARIVEEIALDNGEEVIRNFIIEGRMSSGTSLPQSRVPANKFKDMAWPTEVWGFGPSISAGWIIRDHLRAAIDSVSGEKVPRRTVYIHLGWRKVGDEWVYLHAGGAVGGGNIEVEVYPEFQLYSLPPSDKDLKESMRLSISFLKMGDPRMVYPLWSVIWRAPVCEWLPCTILPWLTGETGTFKSTTAALLLSHYGGPFVKDLLPASWLDTENRLEQKAFLAKDTLLVIDDFAPEKQPRSAQDLESRASRFIRAVGNRQGRGRLRSDLTARPTFYPRGLVISTGEQLPNLPPSALARIINVPFEKNCIDKARLTEMQDKAHLLPTAMRGYLEWLRTRSNDIDFEEQLKQRFEDLRGEIKLEGHSRLPETVAHLYIGLELGITYARELEALDEDGAKEILRRGRETLMQLASEQDRVIFEERPTQAFLQVIGEGLAGGCCWLAKRKSGIVASGVKGTRSEKLGWVDEEGIYLIPGIAHSFINDRLQYRGGMLLGDRALRKMLQKDDILITKESNRLESKARCEGTSQRVLWLRPDALGDLPPASESNRHCHGCGQKLSSELNEKCSRCGWIICTSCRACDPNCEK